MSWSDGWKSGVWQVACGGSLPPSLPPTIPPTPENQASPLPCVFYHWQWVTIMIVSLQCRWYQQMCSPKLWLRHSKRFVTIAQCDNSHFQFRLRDIWLVQVNLHWGKFVCFKIYTILSHSIMYLLPPLNRLIAINSNVDRKPSCSRSLIDQFASYGPPTHYSLSVPLKYLFT